MQAQGMRHRRAIDPLAMMPGDVGAGLTVPGGIHRLVQGPGGGQTVSHATEQRFHDGGIGRNIAFLVPGLQQRPLATMTGTRQVQPVGNRLPTGAAMVAAAQDAGETLVEDNTQKIVIATMVRTPAGTTGDGDCHRCHDWRADRPHIAVGGMSATQQQPEPRRGDAWQGGAKQAWDTHGWTGRQPSGEVGVPGPQQAPTNRFHPVDRGCIIAMGSRSGPGHAADMNPTNLLAPLLVIGSGLLVSAEPAPIDQRCIVVKAGDCGRHTYRIPALIVTPAATALLFCEGRRDSARDEGRIDLVALRSEDHGRTWSEPVTVIASGDGGSFAGNPMPIIEPSSGRLLLLYTTDNTRAWVTESADDGRSWSPSRSLDGARDALPYPTVRIATGPGHGLAMRSGRLVAPIWLSDRLRADQDRDSTPTRHRAGVLTSDDHGVTWQAGGLVPADIPRLHECLVAEDATGGLVMTIRARGAGYRAVSRSRDGGLTWDAPQLDRNLPCPTCQASLLTLPDGRLAFLNPAVNVRNNGIERQNLTLRLSPDDGRTWPSAWQVEAGQSSYSDLAVTADGHLLCAFEAGSATYHDQIVVARLPLQALH